MTVIANDLLMTVDDRDFVNDFTVQHDVACSTVRRRRTGTGATIVL